MSPRTLILATLAATALAGCASTRAGPVEVTRFVDEARLAALGQGTIFVETAPGLTDPDSLELSSYKAAVARELTALGYRETSREAADQVAQVSFDRFVQGAGGRRSPVSVGVGGSTGSYGSGVGLGIGINLGGGSRETVGTELSVMIRDARTNASLWEGRAQQQVASRSAMAESAAAAGVLADALFREFPGNNGETVEVGAGN